MMAPRIAGFMCCQSLPSLVTVTKAEPKNPLATPGTLNSFSASGERAAASRLVNSIVPLSSTVRPGMNFKVAGLGVASVWMNMAFSGVAGSRPAREGSLADGDAGCTVKGEQTRISAVASRACDGSGLRQGVDILVAQIAGHDRDGNR